MAGCYQDYVCLFHNINAENPWKDAVAYVRGDEKSNIFV